MAEQLILKRASATWRAVGQAFLICLAIDGCGAAAQDNRPDREAVAKMIAFARLASVTCERLAPDAEAFRALALLSLLIQSWLRPRHKAEDAAGA